MHKTIIHSLIPAVWGVHMTIITPTGTCVNTAVTTHRHRCKHGCSHTRRHRVNALAITGTVTTFEYCVARYTGSCASCLKRNRFASRPNIKELNLKWLIYNKRGLYSGADLESKVSCQMVGTDRNWHCNFLFKIQMQSPETNLVAVPVSNKSYCKMFLLPITELDPFPVDVILDSHAIESRPAANLLQCK